MKVVNLSSRPFVNERLVVRLTVALWLLGGVLLALNISSYSVYWADSAEVRDQLSAVRAEIADEKERVRDLRQELSKVDLETMNLRAAALNQLIRHRTFPWSRLFDDLEDVLPYEVRLISVRPELEDKDNAELVRRVSQRRTRPSRRGSSSERAPPPPVVAPPPPRPEEVQLALQGTARTDEAIYDFVDNLFAHDAFRDPDFTRETIVEQTGMYTFDIKVVYLTAVEAPAAEAPEDRVADSATGGSTGESVTAAGESAAGIPADDASESPPLTASNEEPVKVPTLTVVGAGSEGEDGEDGVVSQARRAPARTGPPAAGPPAAQPSRGRETLRRIPSIPTQAAPPAAGAPAAPRTLRPARPQNPRVRPPASRRTPQPPPPEPEDTRLRPRFVGPAASGSPTLSGGGSEEP